MIIKVVILGSRVPEYQQFNLMLNSNNKLKKVNKNKIKRKKMSELNSKKIKM